MFPTAPSFCPFRKRKYLFIPLDIFRKNQQNRSIKEKFDTEFKKDPDAAIAFFRSSTSTINGESKEIDGVFTKIKKTLDGLITDEKVNGKEKKGTLKLLETSLNDDKKKLETEKTNTQKRIDDKYNAMAEKWALYDQMIAKLTQQQQKMSAIIAAQMKQ